MKRIVVIAMMMMCGCASINLCDINQVIKKESADGVDCRECKYTLHNGHTFYAQWNLADVGDSITTRDGKLVVLDYETGDVK